MKGSFFLGAGQKPAFELRELQLPALPDDGVLVRNMACGVCGTDVHIYHGEQGSAPVTPPVVLGHEFSGIVERVGASVRSVKPGDHVALDPNMYCGKCRACRMGKKQNCESLYALGVNTNGGFAEVCLAPETQCFRIDESVSFDAAAMAEPLSCVLHGIDRLHIRAGQTVAVIGGGTIGLLMVQLAKLSGAAHVLVSEPSALRREIALRVGADSAVDPAQEALTERVRELLHADGADCVIECVGKTAAAEQAFEIAGSGASVLLFSVPGVTAKAELPLFPVYKKELTVMGSMINPDTFQRAVDLLNSGRLQISPLITHTYGLHQVEDAIRMQMSAESIKVLVHPQEF